MRTSFINKLPRDWLKEIGEEDGRIKRNVGIIRCRNDSGMSFYRGMSDGEEETISSCTSMLAAGELRR